MEVARKTITALLLMCAISAVGQIAIRAGVNIANANTNNSDPDTDFKSRTGIHAGLMFGVPIMERLVFRPGILFSQRGTRLFDSGNEEGTLKFDYIDIPLSLILYTKSGREGLFLEAGLNAMFLSSGKADNENIKEQLESMDYGLLVGGGFALGGGLSLGFNYNFGLSNVLKPTLGNPRFKNRNLAIYASYSF
jgi:hypothetical protein